MWAVVVSTRGLELVLCRSSVGCKSDHNGMTGHDTKLAGYVVDRHCGSGGCYRQGQGQRAVARLPAHTLAADPGIVMPPSPQSRAEGPVTLASAGWYTLSPSAAVIVVGRLLSGRSGVRLVTEREPWRGGVAPPGPAKKMCVDHQAMPGSLRE